MLRPFGTRIEATAMRACSRRTLTLLLTLVAVLVLVAGCAPASGPLGTPSSPAPTDNASVVPPSGDATPGASAEPTASIPASTAPTTAPSESASAAATATPTVAPTPTATVGPSGTTIVRAYFMLGSFTDNAGLVPVLRQIPATNALASAAMRQLIAGPSAKELGASPAMYTSVPATTKLLGITIKDGLATVSLSKEYLTDYSGSGPDSRDAQVVYTLTQFSTVKSVVIAVEGEAGGTPLARDAFRDSFLPAIFVDRPAWGAAAGNPAKITGISNVFEATFRVQLKDANGKVLTDQQAHATCGTGCWGEFAITLTYNVTKAQWGTLRVYDYSAKDGSPENVTEYPVWLTPS